jgi:iron uptake system component EfeO
MPRASFTLALIAVTGLTAALMIDLSICSRAAAQDNSPAPVTNGISEVKITLTGDNGGTCTLDHTAATAGPTTFAITNKNATGIMEVELQSDNRILGEKENLAPGLPTASFTLTLGGGTYQIYCSGAKQELQNFTVTGKAAAAPTGSAAHILALGANGYANYVRSVVDAMVTAVSRLRAGIDAGDLAKAKADYPLAHSFYERIESDVAGFVLPGFEATDNSGNLDYLMDMRASNLDQKVGWHGFHAIERDLFQNAQITDETKKLAAELQKNAALLDKLVKSLNYKPEDLANGAADLLEEVQTTKLTGEEEAFSHYDLVDFAGNIEGAEQAFAFLEPGVEKIDPDLARQVRSQFANVKRLLDAYRDPSLPGGYKLYTAELKASDGARFSKSIQALQEPLSKIAEKVATVR